MARHIFKCEKCGKYTMNNTCSCGGKAVNQRPPKFSPEDRLGGYRRQAKEEMKEAESSEEDSEKK